MKKIVIICGIIVIATILCILLLNRKEYTKDEIKFKNEYEKLNGKEASQGKKYLDVSILKDNNIKYKSAADIIESLQSDSAIIYFGFPECPWCRNLVPVLLKVANEKKYDNIYYFNALSIRDQKHLDENGNIVVDKEGSNDYKKIVELLYNYLGEYEGLNDSSIKRLYFPTVVFVSDGKIEYVHIGTVDSQKDPYIKLTDKEEKELSNIFEEAIKKIESKTCTGVNKC